MKSDLDAILPAKLSELLCIKQSDPEMSYDSFKDFVEGQTAQIPMNSGRLPVHAVDEGSHEELIYENAEDGYTDEHDQELIAWVGRLFKGKGKGKGKGSGQAAANNVQNRSARSESQKPAKCSSCHGDHSSRDCPKPAVDKETCFKCHQPSHVARFCPNEGKVNGVKAVAERVASRQQQRPCFGLSEDEVDEHGFTKIKRGGRPTPRGTTIDELVVVA